MWPLRKFLVGFCIGLALAPALFIIRSRLGRGNVVVVEGAA